MDLTNEVCNISPALFSKLSDRVVYNNKVRIVQLVNVLVNGANFIIATAIKTSCDLSVAAAGDGDASQGGPDTLRPATSRRTWHCRDAVRLDVEETGPLAELPVSIVTTLRHTVQQFPDQIALGSSYRNLFL